MAEVCAFTEMRITEGVSMYENESPPGRESWGLISFLQNREQGQRVPSGRERSGAESYDMVLRRSGKESNIAGLFFTT